MMIDKNLFDEMTNSLSALINIPSVKSAPSPGAPFGENTKKALDYMLDLGDKLGFKTKNVDGYAGYIEFGSGVKQVGILCHLDVVPADKGWVSDPFKAIITDDKIIGRGVIDDKGPAIACLYAMKAIKDSNVNLNCKIRLILGLDEESGSSCMDYYKSKETLPDIAFTPDAKFPVIYAEKGIAQIKLKGEFNPKQKQLININKISGGQKANMVAGECDIELEIVNSNLSITSKILEFKGKPGHASLPEYGENAISKAMQELKIILDKEDITHPITEFFSKYIKLETNGKSLGIDFKDEKSGKLTCNVGVITLLNNKLELILDIRYPVSTSLEKIKTILGNNACEYNIYIDKVEGLAPIYRDPNDLAVQSLLRVYQKHTNESALPIAIGGGTYARAIPNTLAFGPNFNPEDDVAHQAGEYFKIKDFEKCYEIYKDAIIELSTFTTK